ncbi:MAG: FecR domain-containing protein [Magnetovibrio sp.]|nr:FecR domain-containing protein [Magnetovibrio sp.]
MANTSSSVRIHKSLADGASLWLLLCAALSMLILAFTPPAQSAEIGAVKKVLGDAYGTPPQDTRARKYARDNVFHDELIETHGGAATLIEFDDETRLFVGSDSSMMLDEMVYDPSGTNNAMVVNLMQGAFRFVSGNIGSANVTLNTPSAQIGIRGSEAIIFVAKNGDTTINVLKGTFSVRSITDGSMDSIDVTPNQNVTVSATGITDVRPGVHIPETVTGQFSRDYNNVVAPGSSFDNADNGPVSSYGDTSGSSSSSSGSSGSSY